jgi:uncharacterized protein (UPF0332 family)
MPFPNDLLEQARHLANREPKRPKQASLRRAVSPAYYAIFHLLSTETAKNWKRPAERFTVARMLDHTPMVKVCTAKRDELSAYFKTRPAPGRDLDVLKHLHAITNTFVDMLQHRHTADYNGAIKWSRTDVLEKIESVEAAFRSWREIRDEHDAQNFLVTLLLKERKN